jgi:hypothetical protein
MRRKKRKGHAIVKRRRQQDEAGILGIETPASIKRKVLDLQNSWQRLAESYPKDKFIQAELQAYNAWADDVNSSVLNRLFASSIAPKYDSWVQRYKDAFEKAKKTSPEIDPTAPDPGTLTAPVPPARTSPWVWAVIAGSVAVGLYSVYKIRESS